MRNLSLRDANWSDAPEIHAWRCAMPAEFNASSAKPPSLEDHIMWFKTSLEDPDRFLLMIDDNRLTVGHVRLDRLSEAGNVARISIIIDPAWRGKGLGEPILHAACAYAYRLGFKQINAEIHQENSASLKIFRRSGFLETERKDDFLHLSHNPPTESS